VPFGKIDPTDGIRLRSLNMQSPKRSDTLSRPLWVALIACGIALAGWIGLWGAAEDAPLYGLIGVSLPLPVRLGWNLLCALSFTLIGAGALRSGRRALRLIAPAVTGYALVNALILILFSRAEYDQGRMFFQVALSLLVLIPLWWVALRKGWMQPR